MWIKVKDKLPELVDDGYSEEVFICMCKFGNVDSVLVEYTVAWLHKNNDNRFIWSTREKYDLENNPDYMCVTHWMTIPPLT